MRKIVDLFTSKFYKILLATLIMPLLFSGCGNNDTTNPNVYVLKSASLASEKGEWEQALKYAEDALKLDPKNIQAQVMYALALDQNGQQDEAAKYLTKAIHEDPDNFIAQLTLGRILYDKNDYEAAYDKLSNAHSLAPNNIDALILYAQCSKKLLAQNTDELLVKLSETNAYKGKPIIYNELGIYYAKINNKSEAIKNLIKAYKLTPENPTIVLNLAVLCDQYLGQPAKAKYFYRKFISLTNSNPAYNKPRENVTNRLKVI